MKTKHRHELKENDLARAIGAMREWVEPRGKQITSGLLAVIVFIGLVFGFFSWRNRQQGQGQDLLAAAMVVLNTAVVPVTSPTAPGEAPAAASIGAKGTYYTEAQKLNAALPKLQAASDAYPDTEAGITARYHLASSLAALGKSKDAIAQFDQVVKRAGADSLYGRMAQLGKADAQVQGGEVDGAIATLKELAAKKDANLPEDAILMELARAYQVKGNTVEARKTFNQIVDDHPDSPYVADARKELESLKG
jgi:predicted negative regulator of RcsB-dependent stress response